MQIGAPVGPAHAASTDYSTLPSGRGLVAGDIGSSLGVTDASTGSATYAVPIEVAPGTGGLTPQLALQYSSQARNDSWVGYGWSLGFPSISRSVRFGVPTYDDATDVFEFGGEELVPLDSSPSLPKRYRARRNTFQRIEHLADGSWQVTNRDGLVMRFGRSDQTKIKNADNAVFQWLLAEQEDRNGNAFLVTYDRSDPGTAYLASIRYTLRRNTPTGALQSLDGDGNKDRRIWFVLEQAPRDDVSVSYRAGLESRITRRLNRIDVKVGTTLVSRYVLSYAASLDSGRSLLETVKLYGSDADTSGAPHEFFETSFTYRSNDTAETTGWERDESWTWPEGISLVSADRRDQGVRIVDVDGDARPDLVKAFATQSGPDPKTATFALTSNSGMYRSVPSGFEPGMFGSFPSFQGAAGQVPFSLAWTDVSGSGARTTGFDIVDVTGDGKADLVGGMIDLNEATGAPSQFGMPTWYAGTGSSFVPASSMGDVYTDDLWGLNRTGIVELNSLGSFTRGTNSGNTRFADLDGDGLPEILVRGREFRLDSVGGPPPLAHSPVPGCVDEALTHYYFENRGDLMFERAPVVESTGDLPECPHSVTFPSPSNPVSSPSIKRVAIDFQHCDVAVFDCVRKVLFNDAYALWYHHAPFIGHHPWYWLANYNLGVADVDLNGDGLADTISATFDPAIGGFSGSTAYLNNGRRGYFETTAWRLPTNVYFAEKVGSYMGDAGTRLADLNGDGRLDAIRFFQGGTRDAWLNHGVATGANPTPWRPNDLWKPPAALPFIDSSSRDNGVRLIDMNADGMTDIVRSFDGVDEVYLNKGSVPDLLETITLPTGGEVTIGYEPSTAFPNPDPVETPWFPVQVVSSVSVREAPSDPSEQPATTTYSYEQAMYDADLRTFLGFQKVAETRPDGRVVSRRYSPDVALRGLPEREEIERPGGGTPILAIDYSYVTELLIGAHPLVASVIRSESDIEGSVRVSRTGYGYDGGAQITNGNLTAVTEWGEISPSGGTSFTDVVPGDTRTTEIDYTQNDGFLVAKVKATRLRTGSTIGGGTILRESRFYYDGDTTGTVAPTKGNLTQRIDVLGDASQHPDPKTTFGYDGYGNLTSIIDPRQNNGEASGSTTIEYDAVYHTFASATVNAKGHRTEYDYVTPSGCDVAHSAGAGLVGQERGPNDLVAGTSWRRCYDAFGRLVSEDAPSDLAQASWDYDDTPGAVQVTESRTASATGTRDVVTTFDGLGRRLLVIRGGPDGRDVVDSELEYDPVGRVSSERMPAFDVAGSPVVYEYDDRDRVERVTLPGPGRIYNTRYDRGLVTSTDPLGKVTRRQSDPFGRIVRVEEVNGASTYLTTYQYDVADALKQITDQNGNVSTVTYDRLGRRRNVSDPDIGSRDFTYDSNGNVRTEKTGAFETVSWLWDDLNRPTAKVGSSTRGRADAAINWSYDAAPQGKGLVSARRDGTNHRYVVDGYDLLGRPSAETYLLTINNQYKSFHFAASYDPLGQLLTRTYPTGTVVGGVYDSRGYLTSITSGGSTDASSIAWTADGQLAAWTAPGPVVTTLDHDPVTMRLESLEVNGPEPGLLLSESYSYWATDRVRWITDSIGPNSMTFTYDDLGRLATSVRIENGSSVTRTHQYDAIGNLTCRGATGANCAGGTRLQYPFAPGDPLQRATSHQATTIGGTAATYDFGGTLGSFGTRAYTYDSFGRLAQFANGSPQVRATYDASGRTNGLWTPAAGETSYMPTEDFEWAQTSHFAQVHVLLGGSRLATRSMSFTPPSQPVPGCAGAWPAVPGTPIDPFGPFSLFGPGLAALAIVWTRRGWRAAPEVRARALVAVTTGTAFLITTSPRVPFVAQGDARAQAGSSAVYYHADHLGSVRVVTGGDGAVISSFATYEPWGTEVSGGGVPSSFGFNGERAAGGLYDYGVRWYDPAVGRFLQPDPIVQDPFDPQGLGRYAYVRNDPTNRTDPTGAQSCDGCSSGPATSNTYEPADYGIEPYDPFEGWDLQDGLCCVAQSVGGRRVSGSDPGAAVFMGALNQFYRNGGASQLLVEAPGSQSGVRGFEAGALVGSFTTGFTDQGQAVFRMRGGAVLDVQASTTSFSLPEEVRSVRQGFFAFGVAGELDLELSIPPSISNRLPGPLRRVADALSIEKTFGSFRGGIAIPRIDPFRRTDTSARFFGDIGGPEPATPNVGVGGGLGFLGMEFLFVGEPVF